MLEMSKPVFWCPNSWATVNVLKFLILNPYFFWPDFLFLMQLFLKLLSGMANSVSPDQTAPSGAVLSGSALFVYAILSATLVYENFRTFIINIIVRGRSRMISEGV